MNKNSKVKCIQNLIKLTVNNENVCDIFKFKLMNSGEDVSYKVTSRSNRKYSIDNYFGTILRGHCIELTITLQEVTPDVFSTSDEIRISFNSKDTNICTQCIDLPLKVSMVETHKSHSISSLPSYISGDSPFLKSRGRQPLALSSTSEEDLMRLGGQGCRSRVSSGDSAVQRPLHGSGHLQQFQSLRLNDDRGGPVIWILKKSVFLLVCSICVVVIVLPLRGYPLAAPHPLDNWVNHLARQWPVYLLPSHLAQYLAILLLGAAISVFLFSY